MNKRATNGWPTNAYSAPALPIRKNAPVNKLLQIILETKRPTNDPDLCRRFTSLLLDRLKIHHDIDSHNNIFVEIGESTTCFTSHTDTVDNKTGKNVLIQENGYLKVSGGGVLGADCGTGMYIMMRMILAEVPGLYVFFSTEEQGRIGSQKFEMPAHINRCISFDRKGTNNLITTQSGEKGCSDEFANHFIAHFNLPFVKDPTGSYTDSYTFFDTVPECINLSVGYYYQHTKSECQDVQFAEDMVRACLNMDWEALPTVRDPEEDYIQPYANYRGYKITTIYDFCFDEPEIAAAMLEEYGVTLNDMVKYKKAWEQEEIELNAKKLKTLVEEDAKLYGDSHYHHGPFTH